MAAQDLEVSRFWAQVPQEHWKVSRWAKGGSIAPVLRINDIHDYSNGTERREEQIKRKETNQYFIFPKESDHLDHSFFSFFKALWRNQNWGRKRRPFILCISQNSLHAATPSLINIVTREGEVTKDTFHTAQLLLTIIINHTKV